MALPTMAMQCCSTFRNEGWLAGSDGVVSVEGS